jgi:hypothetical protein
MADHPGILHRYSSNHDEIADDRILDPYHRALYANSLTVRVGAAGSAAALVIFKFLRTFS